MEQWRKTTKYAADTDWVFASDKCSAKIPISGSQMSQDYLRPAAERAGVISKDEKKFGWHNLRHSFGTQLAKNGHDIKTIQTLLGHSTPKMATHYLHSTEADRLAAQARLLERLLPATETVQ